jgi:phosphohistidine swiveling domain-containing protein
MEQSLKFKILFECKKIKSLMDYVLPFETISSETLYPKDYESIIIRSALSIENNRRFNSGIGISIADIRNRDDFEIAKDSILSQPNLDFAIYQPYLEHDIHLTVFSTRHFDFVESVGSTDEFQSSFDFLNDKTLSSKKNFMKPLFKFLTKFKQEFDGEHILELGFSKNKLYLYQANSLVGKDLDQSLYSTILKKSLALNQNLKNNSLLNHLRIEKRAHRFREKDSYISLSDCLDNWLYIFFYFKLFCIKNKRDFSQSSFESFLNSVKSKVHLSKMLSKHLEISSITNELFDFNINTVFSDSKEIYLGSGNISGLIDEKVMISEVLDPKMIKESMPSIIFTSYNSILGHPALLCAELGIPLIGGLEVSTIKSLTIGDKFSVDFKLKQFIIEYRESFE